jgi:dipeptide transport system substrate-binding protein
MKRITLLASALLVSTMLAGAANAKSLVYCSEGSPENFTPAINTTGTSLDAARPVYNKLVQFTPGSTEVEPGLAESYEVTDGGKTITFHLRKGVKFHSGVNGFTPTRDFNADDVIWSFERQWKPDHPYAKVSGGAYDYFNDMSMPDLLEAVAKGGDDYTVVMKLTKPNAPIIANLAMDFATIHSAEYAKFLMDKGTPEQFDQIPVGTGPFMFVAYQKDAVIRFKAHPDYWGPKPKVDDLVYAITPDPTARYAKLKANECQVMIAPNPADLDAMSKDPDIQLLQQAGLNIGYLAINVQKPPFDKKEVRQAIAMAIDRDAILKEVYQGAGQKAKNPIPPTMWSYNDSVQDYNYDPEKAKGLLKEAGLETGFETDLWAMPVQRPYNPNAQRMAELVQADWAEVGVKANIVSFEWGEYLKRTQQGEHQTMLLGWTGDNGDPDNFMFVLLGCAAAKDGTNRARWCYKPFDDLLVEAKQSSDQAKRTDLYEQAQVIFKEEAPWVTIAHSVVFMPMRKNVTGYKMDPFGSHIFYGVDIAE